MIYDEQEIKERKRRIYKILESLKKYDNINDRFQEIVESIVKYFDAFFARIWFVDKQRKHLILKFSAGKYTRIDGEFSKISINSLKIGHIAKTNKPVVSNDVVHDPRVKLHDWAKKEKLKSFAGYPLSYKGKSVAVVGMFSRKKLNHLDFELLGLFSDQLSKELAGFFEAKDFLSE
jgi:signal transduction protein with GAF and PtsI domain